MNSEADFKDLFRKSVKAQGGYSFKIAAPTISGLPDLWCYLPGYIPVLLEAKFIKDVRKDKFTRKIKYSALQRELLNNCNSVNHHQSAFGLVGIKTEDDELFCRLMSPEIEVITNFDIGHPYDKIDNLIDVRALFSGFVARIQQG